MTNPEAADFVVLGGGSAGCIVAGRLAAAGHRVLLIEAGEAAESHPETLSADGFKDAFANDATMWPRMSAQLPQMGRKYLGTGRGMGGSGSVNGMVYTRGDAHDFDNWPAGWQYADCEAAFAAVEFALRPRSRPTTPFVRAFIAACCGLGMRQEDGLNTGDLAAKVGANAMNYEGAKRRSSYRAFIKEPMEEKGGALRQNLRIVLRAQVERVEFAGKKAVAVHYRKNGQAERVAVGKEVIFCLGALETPRLLMLSGVGPAAHLQQLGIAVVQDAPGVGQHLQDHPNVALFYRGKKALDFAYPQVYAFDTADGHPAPPEMCWVLYAAPASMQQAMKRMLPIMALPEWLPARGKFTWALRKLIDGAFQLLPVVGFVENVFAIVVILGKPSARGQIRLASADPAAPAEIDPGWYGTARDRQLMERGIARARQMVAQPSLAGLQPKALSKGAKAGVQGKALWRWIHKASMTTYHFAGSCRMGTDAASPVAPADLRVKGLANVRVMDASLMPEIPVSALNAPSMMLGWRGAQMLLDEYASGASRAVIPAKAGIHESINPHPNPLPQGEGEMPGFPLSRE